MSASTLLRSQSGPGWSRIIGHSFELCHLQRFSVVQGSAVFRRVRLRPVSHICPCGCHRDSFGQHWAFVGLCFEPLSLPKKCQSAPPLPNVCDN